MVVDTPGTPLTLKVAAANQQESAQVGDLAAELQALASVEVEIAFVDPGLRGLGAGANGRRNEISSTWQNSHKAKRRFVHLLRRWVVERCFA
jgi:hypothetical protein